MPGNRFDPPLTPLIDTVTGSVTEIGRIYLRTLAAAVAALAPIDAPYWLSHADATLTAEQNIGALATGYLRITTAVGVATPATVLTIPAADIAAGTAGINISGNAATATTATSAAKLTTPRAINGVAFDGTAGITVTAAAATLTGTLADATLSGNVPLLNAANTFTASEQRLLLAQNAATSWRLLNTNAGAAATASLLMDNDVRANNCTLRSYSNAAGATAPDISDSVLLRANGAGGLTLSAQHASGVVRVSTGGVTVRLVLDETGRLQLTAYTAATFVAGDKYLVVDASGNVHRSAIGPAS